MLNFKQFQVFVHVAEHKSFTKTGELLFMTQPAVSWQIKSLESFLGLTLLIRRDRQVLLTDAGKIFFGYAKEITRLYEQTMAAIGDIKGIRLGQIKIGASNIPGEFILPLFIGQFKQRFPEIKVSLDITNSEHVVEWLTDGQIDFGVIGAKMGGDRLTLQPFLHDELLLVAANNHPLAGRSQIAPRDLVSEQFVMREQGSGTRQVIKERLAQVEINTNHLNIVMELGSNQAVITAVEAGLGMSFVSSWAAAEALELGRLQAIPVTGLDLHRPLYVATLPRNYPCPLTEAMLNIIFNTQLQKKIIQRNHS